MKIIFFRLSLLMQENFVSFLFLKRVLIYFFAMSLNSDFFGIVNFEIFTK